MGMKTVNSISGGKTSAYAADFFRADYNIFQLVRLTSKDTLWMRGKDEKTRQLISDRIGMEFWGTAEEDVTIYTILDLEQYLGEEIKILTSEYSFEEMVANHGDRYLPSPLRRYCTTELKLQPTFEWWEKEFGREIVEMRIGYRANEMRRMNSIMVKCNESGHSSFDKVVGQKSTKKGIQNVWESVFWQKPVFPLIEWKPTWKDGVDVYWNGKPVRFSEKNNCVFCVNSELLWLAYQWRVNPEKMNAASMFEKNRKYSNDTLLARADGLTYEKIKDLKFSGKLTDKSFSECDSGFCGL